MGRVLISFLGKARGGEYDKLSYEFGPGDVEETRYIGLALARRVRPDRLVLLGTATSMWDVLLEHTDGQGEHAETWNLMNDELKTPQGVTQSRLDPLAPVFTQHVGVPCVPRLIPLGRDAAEQVQILEVLADAVEEQDQVSLDLTHGLRHLPMLGLLSALYLRRVKQVDIQALYYGAKEMRDAGAKETPVVRLDGLMQLADWISALERYDHSGDYGVFQKLLPDGADTLEEAAFYERTNNASQAKEKLGNFQRWLKENGSTLSPAARLFRPQLEQRLELIKKPDRAAREAFLAWRYLERKDFLRAVIYGYESLVTRQAVTLKKNPEGHDDREEASRSLQDSTDFNTLKKMRNTLAHGLRNKDDDIAREVKSEATLDRRIKDLFKKLSLSR
ncbi:MAG: TIGR02221 family CRISPR-associated protein [Magnetococcus sp. WYHC-3]